MMRCGLATRGWPDTPERRGEAALCSSRAAPIAVSGSVLMTASRSVPMDEVVLAGPRLRRRMAMPMFVGMVWLAPESETVAADLGDAVWDGTWILEGRFRASRLCFWSATEVHAQTGAPVTRTTQTLLPLLLTVTLALPGCGDKDGETGAGGSSDGGGTGDDGGPGDDADGDGVTAADDCDDTDATVYPGAEDADIDGTDQDCDGLDGPDADGDGFVDAASGGDDCDDSDAAAHPGADEVWGDGVDQDCDGTADRSSGACSGAFTFTDGDGVAHSLDPCLHWQMAVDHDYLPDEPPRVVGFRLELNGSGDPAFDCMLTVDQAQVCGTGFYRQADGEAGATALVTLDCSGLGSDERDTFAAEGYLELTTLSTTEEPGSHAGAAIETELALTLSATAGPFTVEGGAHLAAVQAGGDDVDQTDCAVDSGDEDADGVRSTEFGGPDCDDADAAVNPAATELCNTVDDDCDGTIDEDDAADASTWYADADGDGHGDASAPSVACAAPSGTVADDTDCDDTDAAVSPAATELCNTVDDDCDGTTDEDDAADAPTWYTDADSDGFGDAAVSQTACTQPSGTVSDDTDCDDTDAAISPAATEICDAGDADEDCNGVADDADSGVDTSTQSTFYDDSDSDGYGDATAATIACDAPSGTVTDDTDCDDAESTTNPGATEVCNDGADNDCSGDATGCERVGDYRMDYSSESDQTITGAYARDRFGSAVAVVDVTGDGLDDLVVGANSYDFGATDGGGAFVFAGPTSGASVSTATAELRATTAYRYIGQDVAAPGDLDGDGYEDLLLAGDYHSFAVHGPLTGVSNLTAGTDSIEATGLSFDPVGDVTGDGLADVWGMYETSAWLFAGPLTGATTTADAVATISVPSSNWSAGIGYGSAVGDTNGDGHIDFVLGSPRSGSPGDIYFFYGPITGDVTEADADASWAESSGDTFMGLSNGAADQDGDGLDDLLMGAYGDDTAGPSAGAIYVLRGPVTHVASLAAADATLVGDPYDELGGENYGNGARTHAIVSPGDLDGDGGADLLVSAAGYNNRRGRVYLVQGTLSGTVNVDSAATATVTGAGQFGYFGGFTVVDGDLSGDGVNDWVFGAQLDDRNGTNAGAVYILHGLEQ